MPSLLCRCKFEAPAIAAIVHIEKRLYGNNPFHHADDNTCGKELCFDFWGMLDIITGLGDQGTLSSATIPEVNRPYTYVSAYKAGVLVAYLPAFLNSVLPYMSFCVIPLPSQDFIQSLTSTLVSICLSNFFLLRTILSTLSAYPIHPSIRAG